MVPTESLSRYSVCIIAGQGYHLCTAGRTAVALLRRRGWDALSDVGLIRNVLSFGELLVCVFGIILGLIGSSCLAMEVLTPEVQGPDVSIALMVIGGLMGFSVGHTLTGAYGAGVNAVLLSLAADDGLALKESRPEQYRALAEAWADAHPGELGS